MTKDTFFEMLMSAVDEHGYQFQLMKRPQAGTAPIKDLKKRGTIYWKSPSTSLWTPVSVVCYLQSKEWQTPRMAIQTLQLKNKFAVKLLDAVYAKKGYSKKLRKQLLEAVELS